MARFPRLSMLLIVAGATAGCLQGHAMGDGEQGMSVAISEGDAENERHAEACSRATSMAGMMGELEQHDDAMAEVTARMDEAHERMRNGPMMGMGHCSGPRFDHMSGSLEDIHSQMSEHYERMHDAELLDTAGLECATHTDAMSAVMKGMMDDLASMPCIQR